MIAGVIVCTHNPRADYLQRTLEALKRQTLPMSDWELLVIDNGSRVPLADRIDLTWHPHGRVVREDKLGLTHARLRGIAESAADLLVFVDDDNVLDEDYLVQGLRIGREWPQLGVWGGSIVAEYEVSPPKHLHSSLHLLALREVTTPAWSNVWNCAESEPYGAGLCLRRDVALAYLTNYEKAEVKVSDRTGTALLSGGDTDIAFFACSTGRGMGVFPSLRVLHLISAQRLNDDYVVRIAHGITTSSMLLAFKWGGIVPASPYSAMSVARLFRHLVFSRGFTRRRAIARYRALITVRKLLAKPPANSHLQG
jgi:glycosyltransferase involved in cell wall biosynthesis